ncbi:hypothetical protein NDU88_003600 [Pleurodeles waltl]|uniref:Uncharacterized protein n=1 Tax=Pleurodeles waltl TaxID=8319 RepID=A0AAV7WVS4_PLEWA|nr:hypothetical protein NDU88_003600 [Pleurodeles waltl]
MLRAEAVRRHGGRRYLLLVGPPGASRMGPEPPEDSGSEHRSGEWRTTREFGSASLSSRQRKPGEPAKGGDPGPFSAVTETSMLESGVAGPCIDWMGRKAGR